MRCARPRRPVVADAESTLPTAPDLPPPAADEGTFVSQPTAPEAEFDPDTTSVTRLAPGGDGAEATADFDTAARVRGKSASAEEDDGDHAALGGYEVLKRIGKGGMGAVYLARQVSLDRAVALKVMNPEFATDPIFLARFVREAYAAAQLTHHNVVQIHDIGEDGGTSFFSMEFVDGRSLGELLRDRDSVPPAEAVGYILQAASGLRFAHDRGMVHRDIKPDNLMVNGEGIVKVADLGLVKTRHMTKADDAASDGADSRPGAMLRGMADVTRVGTAMGSPSYMAPEQCRDAFTVDARADIYSLGCSLYALLAGRAPFTGKTAVEVISKHLTEPPPPLRQVAASVPAALAGIVDRTLKKDPADRYQSMDELIAALKEWQASQASGPPRPTEEQLTQFEGLVTKLRAGGAAQTIATVGPVVGLVAGVAAVFVSPPVGGAVLLGILAAVVSGVAATGLLTGSYLFRKAREWAFGARLADWLTVGAAVVLFLVGLYFAGLLGIGLGAIIGGAAAGVAFALFAAKPAHDRRLDIKEQLDGVLKRVRLAGVDEDGIRAFVVEAAGGRWEQVFELLYGYPAKVQARADFAEKIVGKPKSAAWRDGLLRRFDAALDARKQARDKKLLLAVETARLEAEGLAPAEAKAKAADAADDLVEQAVEIRAANTDKKKKVDVRAVLTRYDRAKMAARQPRPRANPLAVLLRKLVGIPFDPRLRLLVGAALIVAGLMWVKQNAPAAVATPAADKFLPLIEHPDKFKPLAVGFLPAEVASWVNSVNVLLAGLLAVLSLFVSRTLTLAVMAVGAAVAVVGYQLDLPIPDVGPLKPVHLCGLAGFALGLIALVLLGKKR